MTSIIFVKKYADITIYLLDVFFSLVFSLNNVELLNLGIKMMICQILQHCIEYPSVLIQIYSQIYVVCVIISEILSKEYTYMYLNSLNLNRIIHFQAKIIVNI